MLAIHFADETKWAEYYPPAKWDQVTADPDHVAGLNTPYVDDDEDEDFDDVYDDYGDEESEDEVDENDAAGGD